MYIVNTNISALKAQDYLKLTNMDISKSLSRLSSGIRINFAADDAAGMQIADSLRSQANAFDQSIKNANDALGIAEIADKALDEQIKIMDLIKTKAIQAAQDSQDDESRKALQDDIQRLIKEIDRIGLRTSYNGKSLLSGAFVNKEFQIGAYSHQAIKMTFNSTLVSKIGNTRFETSQHIGWTDANGIKFTDHNQRLNLAFIVDNRRVELESVVLSTSSGTGLGSVANVINKNSNILGGIRASWTNTMKFDGPIISGSITNLKINGIDIGSMPLIKTADKNGALQLAINEFTTETGVEANIDKSGVLSLRSVDGRGIEIEADTGLGILNGDRATATNAINMGSAGRLTLRADGASDIIISTGNFGANLDLENMGFNAQAGMQGVSASQANINLQKAVNGLTAVQKDAVGLYSNSKEKADGALGLGVLTLRSAMTLIDVAETALTNLKKNRSSIGSVQQRLSIAIRNLSSAKINTKASESQIRDIDFATETSKFSKNNILIQAGSYALTQANQFSNLVLKILQ